MNSTWKKRFHIIATRMQLSSQSLAIVVLSCVFLATYGWVWRCENAGLDHRELYGIQHVSEPILYFWMPLPIAFLGLRLLCNLIFAEKALRGHEMFLCIAAGALLLPVYIAFLMWPLLPAKQYLRSGSSLVALIKSLSGNKSVVRQ